MRLLSQGLNQQCVVCGKGFQTLGLGTKGAVLIGSQIPVELLFLVADTVVFNHDRASQMLE